MLHVKKDNASIDRKLNELGGVYVFVLQKLLPIMSETLYNSLLECGCRDKIVFVLPFHYRTGYRLCNDM